MATRKRNQIRSASGLGGPEEGVAISEIWRCIILLSKSALETNSVETNGVDAARPIVKSASGEWSPLQHFCPELGASGVDGAGSWQPE